MLSLASTYGLSSSRHTKLKKSGVCRQLSSSSFCAWFSRYARRNMLHAPMNSGYSWHTCSFLSHSASTSSSSMMLSDASSTHSTSIVLHTADSNDHFSLLCRMWIRKLVRSRRISTLRAFSFCSKYTRNRHTLSRRGDSSALLRIASTTMLSTSASRIDVTGRSVASIFVRIITQWSMMSSVFV